MLILLVGAAMAQDIRIGYVDMKRLLDNAPQVIAGRAALDIEFRPINDELLEDEAQLLQLEQELGSATGLTREQVAAREREIRNLVARLSAGAKTLPMSSTSGAISRSRNWARKSNWLSKPWRAGKITIWCFPARSPTHPTRSISPTRC